MKNRAAAVEFQKHLIKDVYEAARRPKTHDGVRFRGMITMHGGVDTAKRLLKRREWWKDDHSGWKIEQTSEYYIIKPSFRGLFTADEVEEAQRRIAHLKNELRV